MRTIRASEIGTYLYCQRAWGYQKQNIPSQNTAELSQGTQLHEKHGQAVATIRYLRIAGIGLILAALGLLLLYLAQSLV